MKYCPECGNKCLDGEKFCTNCGTKLERSSDSDQHLDPYAGQNTVNEGESRVNTEPASTTEASEKKEGIHPLGIVAFILSFICLLTPISLVLAIVDLIKHRKNKKGLSVAAVVLSVIGIILSICLISGGIAVYRFCHEGGYKAVIGEVIEEIFDGDKATVNTDSSEVEKQEKITENSDGIKVGHTFKWDDGTIKFVSCEDYTDYYSFLAPGSGKKVIKASFEYTNNLGKDSVISIASFSCYADNEKCDNYLGAFEDVYTLETVSSGRSKSGSVYFTVPTDAENVEIEFTYSVIKNAKAVFIVD